MTFIAQWLFFYYIIARYGDSTLSGDFAAWESTRFTPLFKGYIAGDTVGNLAFAVHVMGAAVVVFGGTLQLVPCLRVHALAVHRWNGRAFLVTSVLAATLGLYMVWVRHASLNLVAGIAVSIDAVLILCFVAVAWQAARTRDIDRHRRWALRTFMVANGVFFMRIATGGWSVLTGGLGTTRSLTGPMDYFFEFASYLLPLAVLELYLRAQASVSAKPRWPAAIMVLALTGYTIAGTFALARRIPGLSDTRRADEGSFNASLVQALAARPAMFGRDENLTP